MLASLEDALSGVNATDVALRLVDEQILSRAGETIEQELAEEPRIAGRLEDTIGATYLKLGLYEQAERHTKRAVEIREPELGDLDKSYGPCRCYPRDKKRAVESISVLAV